MKQQWIVNETITQSYALEADSAAAAIRAREKGEGIEMPNRNVNRSANLRPADPQTTVRHATVTEHAKLQERLMRGAKRGAAR
jgi:hypothetical protein